MLTYEMPLRPFIVLVVILAASFPARAQEHAHDNGHSQSDRLHFTHPLVTESVSPDTKVRLDYVFTTPGSAYELEFEGEYAFHPAFSIEAGVHYDLSQGGLGDTHVLFKFANYAFAERGVLLGYGVVFGLPTGDHDDAGGARGHHGHAHAAGDSDIYEIEPFLNAGIRRGALEISGWARFAIPTNQETQSEVETNFRYDLSALYHVGPRLDVLTELNGAWGLSGHASGDATASVVPGVRLRPFTGVNFVGAIGMALPLTYQESFDSRVILSLFYHF